MPPRPSKNLDRALLAAGRALLPHRGCAGLTVREVAEHAGVNLGMFHYHFKSREAFLRALLQHVYEEMYGQLVFEGRAPGDAVELLRASLRFMGRFLRANRPVLGRVLADALSGDPIATAFLRENAPRHLGLLLAIVAKGQQDGLLRPMPAPQALAFCVGSLAMPVLAAGAAIDSGALAPGMAGQLDAALLSDAALDQRIDLALGALRTDMPAPRPPRARRKGVKP